MINQRVIHKDKVYSFHEWYTDIEAIDPEKKFLMAKGYDIVIFPGEIIGKDKSKESGFALYKHKTK